MNIDFKKSPLFTSHIISGSSVGNLWNLLRDNNFKIELRFLPKLLLALPIIFLNIPFVLLEKLLYSGKIKKTEVRQPVFILGYPRSGTTYMMYLMSKDPQFAFCRMYQCMGPHVIFTFGKVLRFIAAQVLPKKRPMDNMELGADVPKAEEFALGNMGVESMSNAEFFPKRFSEHFDRFVLFNGPAAERLRFGKNLQLLFKKLTLKNNGKRLLLKSPFNTGRVKMLLDLYPDAKFIHIHRHPFSVFSSNEKLYESVIPQVAFQTVCNEEMEQHVFYTYKATMQAFFQDKKLLNSSQLYEVGYDEFVANPVAQLKNIYSQLGLGQFDKAAPYIETEVRSYANYQVNKHTEDEAKKAKVFEQLQFVYDELGYTK